ncbi:hypothetical protein N184_32730 [Sinorhizobium sp. GL28]|nr:hypothetical protein N184_32730 [Sinorhizobium sp. GL28]
MPRVISFHSFKILQIIIYLSSSITISALCLIIELIIKVFISIRCSVCFFLCLLNSSIGVAYTSILLKSINVTRIKKI